MYYPRAEFCTDNGAMIALAGCLRLKAGSAPGGPAGARARWDLGSLVCRQEGKRLDKIFIHALKSEAIIGIFDWERQVRQTILIDLEMSADIARAARSDAIGDTLNYKEVAKRIVGFIEASSYHLVETMAQEVAMLVLAEYGVGWVRVRLSQARCHPHLARRRHPHRAHRRGLLKAWRSTALGQSCGHRPRR